MKLDGLCGFLVTASANKKFSRLERAQLARLARSGSTLAALTGRLQYLGRPVVLVGANHPWAFDPRVKGEKPSLPR